MVASLVLDSLVYCMRLNGTKNQKSYERYKVKKQKRASKRQFAILH